MRNLWPLWPALALSAYFVVGLGLFALRAQVWGVATDPDVARRPASRLLGPTLRHFFMWMMAPWERLLVVLRVSPSTVTFASLWTALASAGALAAGRFALGGWLYLLTGALDVLDGRVARATGRVSEAGAFFDSVMDRYAEILVFGGLAIFYRGSWALGVVLLAALGSVMVSYTRARAEALDVECSLGAMQRPERLVTLGVVTALSPVVEVLLGHGVLPPHPAVVAALALLAVTANVTAGRRIVHTLTVLEARAAAERRAPATAWRAGEGGAVVRLRRPAVAGKN